MERRIELDEAEASGDREGSVLEAVETGNPLVERGVETSDEFPPVSEDLAERSSGREDQSIADAVHSALDGTSEKGTLDAIADVIVRRRRAMEDSEVPEATVASAVSDAAGEPEARTVEDPEAIASTDTGGTPGHDVPEASDSSRVPEASHITETACNDADPRSGTEPSNEDPQPAAAGHGTGTEDVPDRARFVVIGDDRLVEGENFVEAEAMRSAVTPWLHDEPGNSVESIGSEEAHVVDQPGGAPSLAGPESDSHDSSRSGPVSPRSPSDLPGPTIRTSPGEHSTRMPSFTGPPQMTLSEYQRSAAVGFVSPWAQWGVAHETSRVSHPMPSSDPRSGWGQTGDRPADTADLLATGHDDIEAALESLTAPTRSDDDAQPGRRMDILTEAAHAEEPGAGRVSETGIAMMTASGPLDESRHVDESAPTEVQESFPDQEEAKDLVSAMQPVPLTESGPETEEAPVADASAIVDPDSVVPTSLYVVHDAYTPVTPEPWLEEPKTPESPDPATLVSDWIVRANAHRRGKLDETPLSVEQVSGPAVPSTRGQKRQKPEWKTLRSMPFDARPGHGWRSIAEWSREA